MFLQICFRERSKSGGYEGNTLLRGKVFLPNIDYSGEEDVCDKLGIQPIDKLEFNLSEDGVGAYSDSKPDIPLHHEFSDHTSDASYSHKMQLSREDDLTSPVTLAEYIEYIGERLKEEMGIDLSKIEIYMENRNGSYQKTVPITEFLNPSP